MSLRWRNTEQLLCAAKTNPEDGDTYIDDRLHYKLALIGAIEPSLDEKISGLWFWKKSNLSYWEK